MFFNAFIRRTKSEASHYIYHIKLHIARSLPLAERKKNRTKKYIQLIHIDENTRLFIITVIATRWKTVRWRSVYWVCVHNSVFHLSNNNIFVSKYKVRVSHSNRVHIQTFSFLTKKKRVSHHRPLCQCVSWTRISEKSASIFRYRFFLNQRC